MQDKSAYHSNRECVILNRMQFSMESSEIVTQIICPSHFFMVFSECIGLSVYSQKVGIESYLLLSFQLQMGVPD